MTALTARTASLGPLSQLPSAVFLGELNLWIEFVAPHAGRVVHPGVVTTVPTLLTLVRSTPLCRAETAVATGGGLLRSTVRGRGFSKFASVHRTLLFDDSSCMLSQNKRGGQCGSESIKLYVLCPPSRGGFSCAVCTVTTSNTGTGAEAISPGTAIGDIPCE